MTGGGRNKATTRAGWVLTGLFLLFMAFDIGIKLAGRPEVARTMAALGWPERHGLTIGAIELAAVILYAVPRTAVLGAVLMTGVLGGAVATHLRVDSPLLTHTLFGLWLGLVMWGGLWLRRPDLRALFPLRR